MEYGAIAIPKKRDLHTSVKYDINHIDDVFNDVIQWVNKNSSMTLEDLTVGFWHKILSKLYATIEAPSDCWELCYYSCPDSSTLQWELDLKFEYQYPDVLDQPKASLFFTHLVQYRTDPPPETVSFIAIDIENTQYIYDKIKTLLDYDIDDVGYHSLNSITPLMLKENDIWNDEINNKIKQHEANLRTEDEVMEDIFGVTIDDVKEKIQDTQEALNNLSYIPVINTVKTICNNVETLDKNQLKKLYNCLFDIKALYNDLNRPIAYSKNIVIKPIFKNNKIYFNIPVNLKGIFIGKQGSNIKKLNQIYMTNVILLEDTETKNFFKLDFPKINSLDYVNRIKNKI